DAIGNATMEKYDQFGRVVSLYELDNNNRSTVSQMQYNRINGLLEKQVDANEQATIYAYDLFGQLTSVKNALGETTTYHYDQLGQHIKTTYPDGKATSKDYDQAGRLIKNVDALGAAEKFYYDKNGNKIKLIDKRKQQFTYAYDNRNRLLSKQGPSEEIAYRYFNDGSRASMTDTTGTTSYQYDPYTGDLTSMTFADGKTMAYTYNKLGQRVKLKTPFDDEIGYSYTSVNQLQQLTWNSIVEADYKYYLNGQARKEEQRNGVNVERTYDQFKLATLQYENEATTLGQHYQYDYDLIGNITNRQATKQSIVMEDNTFTYDALSRIATSTLFDESYTYDKRGNRQTLSTEATPLDSLNVTMPTMNGIV
ncbi:hypothetical protein ACFSTH_07175, partial [Paenibacillus yanchengensis]